MVASHDIDLTRDIASKIASFIVVLARENEKQIAVWGDTNKISIRAPIGGNHSSPVEEMAVQLAQDIGLDTYWVRPYTNDRSAVFDRDYRLVESGDRVMAFFREDRLMEGGTGHVVHAALVRGIPVEAWTHDESGTLTSIGSDDGFEVGYEGSRWMQLRYLEWQAKFVEEQLSSSWGLAMSTASAPPPMLGTVTGVTVKPGGLIAGKIQFGDAKLYVNGNPLGIANGTISVSSSTPPFFRPSRSRSYTEPPSG
jgi:hypothetical protein